MHVRRRSVGLLGLVGSLALLAALLGRPGPPAAAREGPAKSGAAKEKTVLADLGELHAEVSALQVLRALRPTPEQLRSLEGLAAKTMQPAPPRKLVRVSDHYRKTLRGLREALLKNDDAAVDKLLAALDALAAKVSPELEEIELTDDARSHAPKLVRAMAPRQVARYLASVADLPDPLDHLASGLAASRNLRGHKWTDHRDDVAYLVGWLLAGVDPAAEEKARDTAATLLSKAHAMSKKDFDAAADELSREAAGLARAIGPTAVLCNYMERVVAELLSNHRLADAIKAWRKRG